MLRYNLLVVSRTFSLVSSDGVEGILEFMFDEDMVGQVCRS